MSPIRSLVEATLATDETSIEQAILTGGIVADHRLDYGWLYRDCVGGVYYQVPRQLAGFVSLASRLDIQSFCNIGTFNGWTTAFITCHLRKKQPVCVVSVDIKDKVEDPLSKLGIKFHIGTSDDLRGERFDLCLIDGDHSYDWVARDFENIGQHARYCAFHDINDFFCPGVRQFYSEIRIGRPCREFLYHPDDLNLMGIGVIKNCGLL